MRISCDEGGLEFENYYDPHFGYASFEESSDDGYYSSSHSEITSEYSETSASYDEENVDHDGMAVTDYESSDEDDIDGAELLMYFYQNAPERLGSFETEESDVNGWSQDEYNEETPEHSGLCDGEYTPTRQASELYLTP